VHCDRADAVLEEEEGVLDALHHGNGEELGIWEVEVDLMWRKYMARDGFFVDVACVRAYSVCFIPSSRQAFRRNIRVMVYE
jgi:hypothetical protein